MNQSDRKVSGEMERLFFRSLPRIFNRVFPLLVVIGIALAVYGFLVSPEEMQTNQEVRSISTDSNP